MNVDVAEYDGIEQQLEPEIQLLIDSLIEKVCEREGGGICLGKDISAKSREDNAAYLIEGKLQRGKDEYDFRLLAVQRDVDCYAGVMAVVEIGFFPRTYIQAEVDKKWKWVRT